MDKLILLSGLFVLILLSFASYVFYRAKRKLDETITQLSGIMMTGEIQNYWRKIRRRTQEGNTDALAKRLANIYFKRPVPLEQIAEELKN